MVRLTPARAGWTTTTPVTSSTGSNWTPTAKRIKTLSLGQRSALGSVVGLASRAPLTMFDESYLGMDAISRGVFYDELLGDYLRTQRTFIVSTHLIGEIAPLLEQVVVIDHGR